MELICKNCGPTEDYLTRTNGPHTTAYCNKCSAYIKHLPRETDAEPFLYFGKYKNKKVSEVNDLDYLLWMLKSDMDLSNKLSDAVLVQIATLKSKINNNN